MANLNTIDVLFLGADDHIELSSLIQSEYNIKIISYNFPDFVSFTSRKVILNTDKGDFFLKEKPQYCCSDDRLKFAADFQNHLSNKINIVPAIFKTIDGKDYLEWKGRYFFLTKYYPGRIYNGSLEDLNATLNMLYIYNEAKSGFNSNHTKMGSYDVLVPIEVIESELHSESDKKILERAKHVREKLILEYKKFNYSEYICSHGDLSLFNIIYSKNTVIALNDFDNASILPKMQDFAEFLVSASLINYLAPLTNLKLPVFSYPEISTLKEILHFYKYKMNFSDTDLNFLALLSELVWFDIITLAVIKGDYLISDIENVLAELESESLRKLILSEIREVQKVYVWDFTGTLEEGTSHVIHRIASEILQKYESNVFYSYEDFVKLPSFSWKTFVSFHFPNKTQTEQDLIIDEAYNSPLSEKLSSEYLRPKDGALDVLKWVKENGGINIVISNSRIDKMQSYLEKINFLQYFDQYYGVDDGSIKDTKDLIKKKYSLISSISQGIDRSDMISIGNNYEDITIARLAGFKKIYCLLDPDSIGMDKMKSDKVHFIKNLTEIISYE
jgi:phosphoglycolate phosphatase-like HAD superfamily hydrolase